MNYMNVTYNNSIIDYDKYNNYLNFKYIYISRSIVFIINTIYLISEIFEIKNLSKKKKYLLCL